MKKILALAVLSVVALPQASWAGRFDGNALMARCSGPDPKLCEVYLDGFAAALTQIAPDVRHACLPDSVTSAQMKDVLLKYLRNEPEHRDWVAAKLTLHAFAKAWPCHP